MTTPQNPTSSTTRPPSAPPVPPVGQPVPPLPPVTTRTVPAAPLGPAPGRERGLRTVLVVVAVLCLVLTCGGMAVGAGLSAAHRASFTRIPASQELGTPSDLILDVPTADVRVVTDDAADQVGLSLVEEGAVDAGPDETARARITRDGNRVEVEQPVQYGPFLPQHEDHRDVVLTVPTSLADSFSLHLDHEAGGNVEISGGTFQDLTVSTSDGDVDLQDLTVSGDLSVSTDTGDADVRLSEDADPRSVSLGSDVGSVDLAVPRGMTFRVDDAVSDVGEVDIDPDIDTGTGPTLRVESSTGDVTVGH